MSSRFTYTSNFTKLVIIIEFVLVSYLLFSLTKNVYNTYQVDHYIENFEKENMRIEADNKQRIEDYLYFTSEEYIDKIAKQNLGLVNPGEEVIILTSRGLEDDESFLFEEDFYFAQYGEKSKPKLWLEFFFE